MGHGFIAITEETNMYRNKIFALFLLRVDTRAIKRYAVLKT